MIEFTPQLDAALSVRCGLFAWHELIYLRLVHLAGQLGSDTIELNKRNCKALGIPLRIGNLGADPATLRTVTRALHDAGLIESTYRDANRSVTITRYPEDLV